MSEIAEPIETAKVRPPRKSSPFWLLPIVAFAVGCLLFFQILQERGELITIRFHEGDGITAGKTTIRYQGLQIGQVKKVYFINNLKEVEVQAEINPEARSVLRADTKFWLVKPSASLAGVSGLDALVSGNYITLIPGEGESQDEFVAEEEAPAVVATDGDLLVRLVADDLGSITVGANVYFRKVPVGSIADYRFTRDQKKVEIDVLIDKKYSNLVKENSHFWNISGVSIDAKLSGLKVEMDSLASVVQGAIAFDSPTGSEVAAQGQKFDLYPDFKAAQRGVEVKVSIPLMPNLKVNETPVFSQNVQIGVLSHLAYSVSLDEEDQQMKPETQNTAIQGTLLIDPNYADLFRTETRILLKEPQFSLDKAQLSKIGELLRGIYFEVDAGKGEQSLSFNVQKEADYLLTLPNLLAVNFSSPKAYGVEEGQGIYYNDVKIGQILKRHLNTENVRFEGIIFPSYRQLIAANSQFVAISNMDISLGLEGLRVHSGSPTELLTGGIRLLNQGKPQGQPKASYPLFKDVESAELGLVGGEKTANFRLSAASVAGIGKGSLLLYRDFEIGEVLSVTPQKSGFEVALFVQPAHRHLLTEKSRFWIEPAVAVDVSMQGVKVAASPLMRTLKGAISFDNQGSKKDLTLYASQEKATSGNTFITLIAKDASKLSQGMPVKYMGLKIGEIEAIELQNAKKQLKLTAYIEGKYHAMIAKTGSSFSVISPEISTAGVKNLDAALQNYINVEAGTGKPKSQFNLADTDTLKTQYQGGLPLILETSDANGIQAEAPVLYRGLQVGVVERLGLSELGDRVNIHLRIAKNYQHLVRTNSEFWAESGYTMDVSLQGVSMNSGTMSQLLKGGIAFATPSGRVVHPQASPNRRFLLQRKEPAEAPSWDQGAAE